NYDVTLVNGTLTVDPAELTITANDASRTYGSANPTFSGTVGPTQNGDVITATYTTTATPSSNAGNYAIVPTPSGSALSNYNFNLVNGTLTVNKAALTITANDAARAYGAANPSFTGAISGIQNNDLITASYTTPATAASPVGTYTIVPTPAGVAVPN